MSVDLAHAFQVASCVMCLLRNLSVTGYSVTVAFDSRSPLFIHERGCTGKDHIVLLQPCTLQGHSIFTYVIPANCAASKSCCKLSDG